MAADEPEVQTLDETNPYFAKVIGFVDASGQLVTLPDEQQHSLLINVGEHDDVKVGERVLVFSLGPELIDPDSRESLGHFEVVRGEGKVSIVQARMSIITSSRTVVEQYARPVNALAVATGMPREYETRNVAAPFRNPQLGDLVRFI